MAIENEIKTPFSDEIFLNIGFFLEPKELLYAHVIFREYTNAFNDPKLLQKVIISDLSNQLSKKGSCVFVKTLIADENGFISEAQTEQDLIKQCLNHFFEESAVPFDTLKKIYQGFQKNQKLILSTIAPAFFSKASDYTKKAMITAVSNISDEFPDFATFILNLAKFASLDINSKDILGKTALSEMLYQFFKNQKCEKTKAKVEFIVTHGGDIKSLGDHDYELFNIYTNSCKKQTRSTL